MDHVRDWFYTHGRAAWFAVAVSAMLLVVVFAAAPPAHADAITDACGAQPDWWNAPAWISWDTCAISNGGAAATLTEITSPVLNNILDAVNGISGPIVDAVNAVPNPITSAISGVVNWITPHPGDFDSLTSVFTELNGREPFHMIGVMKDSVTALDASWNSLASIAGGGAAPGPGVSGAPGTVTGTSSDFGVLGTGVQYWLDFMARVGLPQSLFKDLFSFFLWATLVWSILSDIGVRSGALEPMQVQDGPSDAPDVTFRGRSYSFRPTMRTVMKRGPGRIVSRRYG